MEVILRQDIEKLGLRGEVVEVAPGFARNYLLPRKLAEAATPAKVAELRKLEEISRVLKITDGVMRHLAVRRVQGGTTRPPEPAPEERVAVAAPARQDSSETETAPGEESE